MTLKNQQSKDLGVKIGSVLEQRWTEIKDRVEKEIITAEIEIVINKAIIKKAEEIIQKEKETFK